MNKFPFVVAALSLAISTGCKDVVNDLGDNLDDSDKEQISEGFASLFGDFEDDSAVTVNTNDALESDYIEDEEAAFTSGGNAKLAGVVGVSELTPRMLARMSGVKSTSSYLELKAKAAEAITSSSFKVYWMDGKGNKNEVAMDDLTVETYTPVSGNPQFIISGVSDGLNYIVEIEVLDSNNVPRKISNIAYVPKGQTQSTKIEVSPTTTVIAEVVVQKVKSSYFETGGEALNQNFIEDLNDTLTAVIKDAITQAQEGGDFDIAEFTSAIENKESLDRLVAKIVTNEDISEQVSVVEKAAVTESFEVEATVETESDGRAAMAEIFAQLIEEGDGGGAPQYIIDFFGDQFAAGSMRSVTEVMESIFEGIEFEDQSVAAELTTANAITAFSTELGGIYSSIAQIAELEAVANRTDAQKTQLKTLRAKVAEIPDVVMGTFPPSRKAEWLTLDGNSEITVPQAVTITIFVTDKYLKDLVSFERNSDGEIDQKEGYDFNPQYLMGLYGWGDDAFDIEKYAGISVGHFDVYPNTIWNGQEELNVLSMWACYESIGHDYDVSSVSVTYPTAGGVTQSVELSTYSEGDNCWTLDPWYEGDQIADDYRADDVNGDFIDWNGVWQQLGSEGKLVSDFVSGSYTVTVTYNDGETVAAPFEKRLILGMNHLHPVLTSPLAEPKAPDNGGTQAQWEAFSQAQLNFTMSTFAPGEKIELSWDEPDYSKLPEGVVPVYQLDIGHEVCDAGSDETEAEMQSESTDQGGAKGNYDMCRWEHVYATWEKDIRIFGNKFIVPVSLEEQSLTDRPYQVNVNVEFIDENTGQHVGQGGYSHAPFRVGEAIDLSGTFNLTGQVNNLPETDSELYKVALIKESCSETKVESEMDSETQIQESSEDGTQSEAGNGGYIMWTCSTETMNVTTIDEFGSYTLTPTVQSLMQRSHESWVEVRVFFDADSDNELDADNETGEFEQMWWPIDYVWFNVWGGLLHAESENCSENQMTDEQGNAYIDYYCEHSSKLVLPDTNVDGPSFDLSQDYATPGDEHKGDDNQPNGIYLNNFAEVPEYAVSDYEGDHVELNVSNDPTFSWTVDQNYPEVPDFYQVMVMKVSFEFFENMNSDIGNYVTEIYITETTETSIQFSSSVDMSAELKVNTPFANASVLTSINESGFYIWRVDGMKEDTQTDDAYHVANSSSFEFFPGDFEAIEPYLPEMAECYDQSGAAVSCESMESNEASAM
ncbi:hypothetical protein [Marinicellulosiphila megalodicopiae]|uniref:hypothetical protein n=1 Tax=Marinicellulosiphila megalodicopiae TaxID=2724896 RepID=UPI003BB14D00